MPGYLIELDEETLLGTSQFTEFYTEQTFNSYLKKGTLIRPLDAGIAHFQPELLRSIFTLYKKNQSLFPSFEGDLKLAIYRHSFAKDPDQLLWPWSCGFSSLYKDVPFIFPYFSGARLVMISNISEETKLSHLRETFLPVLREKNILMRFTLKKDSLTHKLLCQIGEDFSLHYRPMKTLPDGQILSNYIFARSKAELSVLQEDDFWRVENELFREWMEAQTNEKYRQIREAQYYTRFPSQFI